MYPSWRSHQSSTLKFLISNHIHLFIFIFARLYPLYLGLYHAYAQINVPGTSVLIIVGDDHCQIEMVKFHISNFFQNVGIYRWLSARLQ